MVAFYKLLLIIFYLKLLHEYFQNTYWELESWSFASRLVPHTDVLSMMKECIDAFYDKVSFSFASDWLLNCISKFKSLVHF